MRIAYRSADGNVCIVNGAPGVPLASVMKAVPQDATDIHQIEDSDVPADRTFRNAWDMDKDGRIVTDMVKARVVQQDRLRADRAPLFAQLDTAFMRAVEKGDADAIKAIGAEKQKLRDATLDPRIMRARTPDDLKSISLPVVKTDW